MLVDLSYRYRRLRSKLYCIEINEFWSNILALFFLLRLILSDTSFLYFRGVGVGVRSRCFGELLDWFCSFWNVSKRFSSFVAVRFCGMDFHVIGERWVWGFQKAFGFALFWLWMISLGLGLGLDVGGEMEETDLEEGEACYYQNHNNDDDDDNSSIDPDVALSYIVSLLFSPSTLQKQVLIFQFCCYSSWSLHVRFVYIFRCCCWLVWYVLDQLVNPSYNWANIILKHRSGVVRFRTPNVSGCQ